MWKHSGIVNTHRRFSSRPQLSLIRIRTQNLPSLGRRRIHIFVQILHLEFYSRVIWCSKYDQNYTVQFSIPVLENTFLAMELLSVVPMHTSHSFLGKTWNPLALLLQSAKEGPILIHVNNFVRSTLWSHLCFVIGEFLKAKTPIFFKIDFSRIFKLFSFYKEQLTSNEVSCPAAILFWASRIQNEAQTDLA